MTKSIIFKWIALAMALAAALAMSPSLWADEIHEAAKRGDLEKVRSLVAANPALVAAGADVGIESRIGTALHRAALTGQTEVIRVLLEAGAKTEVMSRRFYPLHLAAMTGHLEAVSALVKGGADVNSLDGGSRTPLHRVLNASDPHVSEIARFFIDGGADVDTTDEDGETPLMTAVREGYTEVVRSLLEKGARTDVRDRNFNQTLLHTYAAYVMEKLRPKAVLPMDTDQRVMDYKKMAEWLKAKCPGVQTGCGENPGDAYIYDQGKSSLHRSFYFSPQMGALLHESRSRKTG